jgi:tRNA (pseudouridine54-N1)-methyltransferase
MREFIYYSEGAPTSGKMNDDLKKAGRMDIALNTLLGAFFISNRMREDVKLHLVFAGPPDPVKHLELEPAKNNEITLSKKDLLWVVKKLLYKFRKGEKHSPFEGYSVEKKDLLKVVDELASEGREIYVLDEKGNDIREEKFVGNEVFILGDHEGIPKKERRALLKKYKAVSIGKPAYLASQVIAIVQNELDRQLEFG